MTVFLFAAGGVLAGAGTRVCVVALVAAAVFGARQPQPLLAALGAWTAASAAAYVLLERASPRDAVLPLLGSAAVLAAAGSPNGAVVLGLWVLGTIAAVMSRGEDASGRRWALGLAASDVVLAVAVATTAGRGFEGWPFTLRPSGAVAMLAAAVIRAPLAGGPRSQPTARSSLVVRTQAAVLIALAAASADRTLLRVMIVLGALAFAAAPLSSVRSAVDGLQELGLLATIVGAAALGWVSIGWAWGVLAAGTLIHSLRFTLGRHPSGPLTDAIGRGAGIALPFLPPCAALLEGAFRSSSDLTIVVVFAVLAGLAGRTASTRVDADSESGPLDVVRAWVPPFVAAAASVAAPLLWLPDPPAGGEVGWPPLWGAAIVLVAAIGGSQLRGVVSDRDGSDAMRSRTALMRLTERPSAILDVVANDVVLWATVTAVAAAAVVLWLVGLGRGFL